MIDDSPHNIPEAGDVVTPLRLLLTPDGPRLTASPAWRTEAEAAACRLASGVDPCEALREVLLPRMTALGCVPLPQAWTPTILHASNRTPPPPDCPGLMPLYDAPILPWSLTHPRGDLSLDAWVVIADGRMVSAAWTTDAGVAVETAPAYRRRGYARAAAAAHIRARMEAGREVTYRCAATNAASLALAASLGMNEIAREYRPGFRRMNLP